MSETLLKDAPYQEVETFFLRLNSAICMEDTIYEALASTGNAYSDFPGFFEDLVRKSEARKRKLSGLYKLITKERPVVLQGLSPLWLRKKKEREVEH